MKYRSLRYLTDYVVRKQITTKEDSESFVAFWYRRVEEAVPLDSDTKKDALAIRLFDYMSTRDFWRSVRTEFLRMPDDHQDVCDPAVHCVCGIPGLGSMIKAYGEAMDLVGKRYISRIRRAGS